MFQTEESNLAEYKSINNESKLEVDLMNIKVDFENKFNFLKESFIKVNDVSNFSRDTGYKIE